MKTVGTYLVELLAAYGVDTVFGIPGVHTVEMYRGLPGSGIRYITAPRAGRRLHGRRLCPRHGHDGSCQCVTPAMKRANSSRCELMPSLA